MKTAFRLAGLACVLTLAGASGCSKESSLTPPSGVDSGAAGSAGTPGQDSGIAGAGGVGGHPSGETPLLERPLPAAYDCTVARPVVVHTDLAASSGTLGVPTAAGIQLGYVVSGWVSTPGLSKGIFASTLSSGGTVATPMAVHSANLASTPLLIRQGNGTTLAWTESEQIWTAQIDDTNNVVTPARSQYAARNAGSVGYLRTAMSGSQARLFWGEMESDSGPSSIRTVALTSEGSFDGQPTSVVDVAASSLWLDDVVPFESGFALVYADGVGINSKSHYLALDAALKPRHAAVDLGSGRSGSWGQGAVLLAHGSQVLVAKTVKSGDYDKANIAGVVEITRLDSSATRVAGPTPLKAPVEDVTQGPAMLLPVGDDVGLLWSEGSVIYMCAGCTPDDALNFVVLDGTSLRPKSNVVTFPSPDAHGGLVQGQLVGANGDFHLLTAVQYHVTSSLASGRLTCTARAAQN